jgi:dinuclear metal center YbgI/SA1388 family protein
MAGERWPPIAPNHCGCSVTTTKYTASATVTACVKINQSLRMKLGRNTVASRDQIDQCLKEWLDPQGMTDYCPNGLQVEGRAEVRKLVTGVTADAIFVHHGLFWRGQDGRIKGWMRQRLAPLLAHEVSLFAYHLPLDAHPQLGNNAQLADRLRITPEAQRFGDKGLGWLGIPPQAPVTLAALSTLVQYRLGRVPTVVEGDGRPIQRVAWCTGGAQDWFEDAIAAGADAFITGEISEPQAHLARETGVAFLACGHHATERYGVAAVGAHLAAQLGIEHQFIDIDNPA